jgi:hypothetical protein
MERHYSLGTADLVGLMAAHRATMARAADQFDQSLVNRLRAALEVPADPPPRDRAATGSTARTDPACRSYLPERASP